MQWTASLSRATVVTALLCSVVSGAQYPDSPLVGKRTVQGEANAMAETGTITIDIFRDGETCPTGTEPSAKINGFCSYGNHVSDRSVSGKCCFHPTQYVFLQSLPGAESHLNATYRLDSQPCCGTGEEGTALINGKCEYGTNSLPVPTAFVSKCCWNPTVGDFAVHLNEFQPLLNLPNIDADVDGQAPNGVCNLGYKIHITSARVYGNRVEVDISVNIDCATYNDTSKTTLTIYSTRDYTAGGRLTYSLSWFGPTVYVDLSSKVNTDNSLDIHGRITGSGVLGRLEEGFTVPVKNDMLELFLGQLAVC
ncbi:hypothetical protein J1614_003546 [Plenodomus biglobosus]|nr:hypothetical protein J1614_003546 [Plenodomus biglobosus]